MDKNKAGVLEALMSVVGQKSLVNPARMQQAGLSADGGYPGQDAPPSFNTPAPTGGDPTGGRAAQEEELRRRMAIIDAQIAAEKAARARAAGQGQSFSGPRSMWEAGKRMLGVGQPPLQ